MTEVEAEHLVRRLDHLGAVGKWRREAAVLCESSQCGAGVTRLLAEEDDFVDVGGAHALHVDVQRVLLQVNLRHQLHAALEAAQQALVRPQAKRICAGKGAREALA